MDTQEGEAERRLPVNRDLLHLLLSLAAVILAGCLIVVAGGWVILLGVLGLGIAEGLRHLAQTSEPLHIRRNDRPVPPAGGSKGPTP